MIISFCTALLYIIASHGDIEFFCLTVLLGDTVVQFLGL